MPDRDFRTRFTSGADEGALGAATAVATLVRFNGLCGLDWCKGCWSLCTASCCALPLPIPRPTEAASTHVATSNCRPRLFRFAFATFKPSIGTSGGRCCRCKPCSEAHRLLSAGDGCDCETLFRLSPWSPAGPCRPESCP